MKWNIKLGAGWPSRNILDFHAGLPKGWGSNTFVNGHLWFATIQAEAESVILFVQLTLPKMCIWFSYAWCHTWDNPLLSVTKCHARYHTLPLERDVIIKWPPLCPPFIQHIDENINIFIYRRAYSEEDSPIVSNATDCQENRNASFTGSLLLAAFLNQALCYMINFTTRENLQGDMLPR